LCKGAYGSENHNPAEWIITLDRGKKATAKVAVKLTDLAGNSESEKLSVRLKRG
jgi:hypothetical protein